MKNNLKIILSLSIVGFGVLAGALIIGAASFGNINIASAQTTAPVINGVNIHYPVAALGNCSSQQACKTYCDDPSHMDSCLVYAQQNNLMSQDDINAARKFLAAGAKGPGGCASQDSCQSYCNNVSHIDECVAFAEKTGIVPPQQLEEAKKVQAAIHQGVQPPACSSKEECDAYCSNPSNMKVCITFGEATGMLQGQDLENAQKALAAINKGVLPPPCKGQDECQVYCSEPSHTDACINFAVAAGMMSEQDAEMAKKTGGKGPGGCASKDQCDTFCNNPDNQQTCFNFAKDNGLISPQDLQKMQEGQKQTQQALESAPPQVLDCLNSTLGSDTISKLKSGELMPSQDIGEKMSQCFSIMGSPNGQSGQPGQPGQMGPQTGPGAGIGFPPVSSMPQEMQDCVKSAVGADVFGQLQSGSIKNEDEAGLFDKAKSCFEKYGPVQQPPQGMQGNFPPMQAGLPAQAGATGTGQPFQQGGQGMPPQGANNPELQSCIQQIAGSAQTSFQNLTDGQRAQIGNCMAQFQSQQGGQSQINMTPPQGVGSSSPQQIMPPQNQEEGQPGQYPPAGGQEGMPLQGQMPFNQMTPASGTYPEGAPQPQQIAPQGQIQPMVPPPQPQTSTPPQSENYPSANSLLGLIINFFFK